MTSAVDRVLAAARARISILDPATARRHQQRGALLVDTRPVGQRAEFGTIEGAVAIERNHLEWRLDRTGDHQHPAVTAHRAPIIVFCQEGFASSLAVASLVDIGVADVHDLGGGFAAWAAAGLPIVGPG